MDKNNGLLVLWQSLSGRDKKGKSVGEPVVCWGEVTSLAARHVITSTQPAEGC